MCDFIICFLLVPHEVSSLFLASTFGYFLGGVPNYFIWRNGINERTYQIFQTKMQFPLQIWEENGGASYSLNVAYLALRGRGMWGAGQQWSRVFFSYFPPLKPRCVLRSSASYSLKMQYVDDLLQVIEKVQVTPTCMYLSSDKGGTPGYGTPA